MQASAAITVTVLYFHLLLTVVQMTPIGVKKKNIVRSDYCVMMFIIIFICVNI